MSTAAGEAVGRPDAAALAAWLREALGARVTVDGVRRLAGGHSSGAWLLEARLDGAPRALVLQAPESSSLVYRRDPVREARILSALARRDAPVPRVVAIDAGTRAVGRPCFVMEYVEGRSVPDTPPGGYYADGWFRDASPEKQRAVWHSFHDALARLHAIAAGAVPEASHGPGGVRDVLHIGTRLCSTRCPPPPHPVSSPCSTGSPRASHRTQTPRPPSASATLAS
jgi:aminoglycoside phosphotransferase (APT) family kinase protein